MKASKFSDAQKAFILKQDADGMPVADICGNQPGDLFQLEEEIRRLAADRGATVKATRGRECQVEAHRDGPFAGQGDAAGRHPPKNLRPFRHRKLVNGICSEWGASIRRACRVFEVDTSTYHYKSRRPEQASSWRIREICQTRVRYGYRRVHVLLWREGWQLGQIKTQRIYCELGLQSRNKTPKRRVKAKLPDDRTAAERPRRGNR